MFGNAGGNTMTSDARMLGRVVDFPTYEMLMRLRKSPSHGMKEGKGEFPTRGALFDALETIEILVEQKREAISGGQIGGPDKIRMTNDLLKLESAARVLTTQVLR